MGHIRENMVGDVGANVMVNGVNEAVIPINGGEGTFEKIPVITTIPRDIVFSVM